MHDYIGLNIEGAWYTSPLYHQHYGLGIQGKDASCNVDPYCGPLFNSPAACAWACPPSLFASLPLTFIQPAGLFICIRIVFLPLTTTTLLLLSLLVEPETTNISFGGS